MIQIVAGKLTIGVFNHALPTMMNKKYVLSNSDPL